MMSDITAEEEFAWRACDPNENTPLGVGPTYEKFITFVKWFLARYMALNFVEEDYYRELWDEIWKNKNCVLQLPRGHSKTELIGIWVTIYIAAYQPLNPFMKKYRGINKPVSEQLLLAGAGDDLDAWSDRVKDFFYRSPKLAQLRPYGIDKNKTSSKWNNKKMVLTNGSIIHLRSLKGKIRGLHVDRICADDLITESSTLTDSQTIAIWDGAVDGTTTAKEALVNVIGTPLRFTDIQYHLKNKPDGYYFKARPAIIYQDNKVVLAPNRRSFEDLMRVKARIGSTKFSTEYMLNPIDDHTSLIKRANINLCLDQYFEGLWLKPNIQRVGAQVNATIEKLNNVNFKRSDWDEVYVTCDFAFSDKKKADWAVYSYYGLRDGRAHKLGYIRGQGWSSSTQRAILFALKDYLGVTQFGLEENSIKGIAPDWKSMGLPMKLFWMGGKDPSKKKKPEVNHKFKSHTIGKLSAIERLDAAYETRRFTLPYKTELDKEKIEKQIQESISWAQEDGKLVEIGDHPDIPITDILMHEMMSTKSKVFDFATIGANDEYDDEMVRKIKKGPGILGEGEI